MYFFFTSRFSTFAIVQRYLFRFLLNDIFNACNKLFERTLFNLPHSTRSIRQRVEYRSETGAFRDAIPQFFGFSQFAFRQVERRKMSFPRGRTLSLPCFPSSAINRSARPKLDTPRGARVRHFHRCFRGKSPAIFVRAFQRRRRFP